MDEHGERSVRSELAELCVAVGRLDERLRAMSDALGHHMSEEHKDFEESLRKVESLGEVIRDMRSAARVTRWIAAIVSGILAVLVWIKDHVAWK